MLEKQLKNFTTKKMLFNTYGGKNYSKANRNVTHHIMAEVNKTNKCIEVHDIQLVCWLLWMPKVYTENITGLSYV